MSEARSMKRSTGRQIGGRNVLKQHWNPSHAYGSRGDWDEEKYVPKLVALDYLNMELPPEQRAELRRQALASCVGFKTEKEAE